MGEGLATGAQGIFGVMDLFFSWTLLHHCVSLSELITLHIKEMSFVTNELQLSKQALK